MNAAVAPAPRSRLSRRPADVWLVTAVAALNAITSLVGVATALGMETRLSYGWVPATTVVLGLLAAAGWGLCAVRPWRFVEALLARPRRVGVVLLLLAAAACGAGGGWLNPLFLHIVTLSGTYGLALGGRAGLAGGLLTAALYTASVKVTADLDVLEEAADLGRIPINALALALAGAVGGLLHEARVRLRGLAFDLDTGLEREEKREETLTAVGNASGAIGQFLKGILDARSEIEPPRRAQLAALLEEHRGGRVGRLIEAANRGSGVDGRLQDAVRVMARHAHARSGLQLHVEVKVDVAMPDALPEPVESAAIGVVRTALKNVLDHATDARRATVAVDVDEGPLEIHIRDDGSGEIRQRAGGGLDLMREALRERTGGNLFIDGKTVSAAIPVVGGPVEKAASPVPVKASEQARNQVDSALEAAWWLAAVDCLSLALWDPWTASGQRPAAVAAATAAVIVSLGGATLQRRGRLSRRQLTVVRALAALAGALVAPTYRSIFGVWGAVAAVNVAREFGWRTFAAFAPAMTAALLYGPLSSPVPESAHGRIDVTLGLAAQPLVWGLAAVLVGLPARTTERLEGILGSLDERAMRNEEAIALERDAHERDARIAREIRPLLSEEDRAGLSELDRKLRQAVGGLILGDEYTTPSGYQKAEWRGGPGRRSAVGHRLARLQGKLTSRLDRVHVTLSADGLPGEFPAPGGDVYRSLRRAQLRDSWLEALAWTADLVRRDRRRAITGRERLRELQVSLDATGDRDDPLAQRELLVRVEPVPPEPQLERADYQHLRDLAAYSDGVLSNGTDKSVYLLRFPLEVLA